LAAFAVSHIVHPIISVATLDFKVKKKPSKHVALVIVVYVVPVIPQVLSPAFPTISVVPSPYLSTVAVPHASQVVASLWT